MWEKVSTFFWVLQVWVYSWSSSKIWKIKVNFLSGLDWVESLLLQKLLEYARNMGMENSIRGLWILNEKESRRF